MNDPLLTAALDNIELNTSTQLNPDFGEVFSLLENYENKDALWILLLANVFPINAMTDFPFTSTVMEKLCMSDLEKMSDK